MLYFLFYFGGLLIVLWAEDKNKPSHSIIFRRRLFLTKQKQYHWKTPCCMLIWWIRNWETQQIKSGNITLLFWYLKKNKSLFKGLKEKLFLFSYIKFCVPVTGIPLSISPIDIWQESPLPAVDNNWSSIWRIAGCRFLYKLQDRKCVVRNTVVWPFSVVVLIHNSFTDTLHWVAL